MMTGLMQDQNLEKQIEKQIGCMSGFLHIFDRQQILAGKRIYATKRLPPSTGMISSPESVKSVKSVKSVQTTPKREVVKPVAMKTVTAEPVVVVKPESPEPVAMAITPPKSPLPLPLFELKEGNMKTSWKFCKEMPRLSLDSRATVDSKGSLCPREIRRENGANNNNNSIDESFDKQRRSPSVIARLMGLDQLPSSDSLMSSEPVKTPELRRSASESRVSRDLFHSRFIETNPNFHVKQTNQTTINKSPETNLNNNNNNNGVVRVRDNVNNQNGRNLKSESQRTSQWRSPQQKRSFFDSADIFPEPKQTVIPTYGDLEKNLKLREIDEQSKDLETLKHILEALQLKGLLHSRRPPAIDSQHNFVFDPSFPSDDPNIILMKPSRSQIPNRRCRNDSSGMNRYTGESLTSVSPRRVFDRNGRSPIRSRNPMATNNNSKNSNTIVKRKPLSIETQRSFNESSESRRSSPINSPKLTPRRNGSDPQFIPNRSPRSRKPADVVYSKEKVSRNLVMEDESSYFSESSGSTTSQSDPERSKMEEYREGKSLLQRCDKLLNSIAEMNSITESHMSSSSSVLPSPVSVLDSVFDKDESSSPSPVMKRSIDFKDLTVDLEDDIWNSVISPVLSSKHEDFTSNDSDFNYISDIIRASKYLPDDSGVFLLLEKQPYLTGNNNTSKASKLQRKLVFDTVAEIVDRNRQLPPWNAISLNESTNSVSQICNEFQKIRGDREQPPADNLLDLICGVLKRDLAAGNNGWEDFPVEISESVLYIERLIFKDLVSETILDLAAKSRFLAPRRKLVF